MSGRLEATAPRIAVALRLADAAMAARIAAAPGVVVADPARAAVLVADGAGGIGAADLGLPPGVPILMLAEGGAALAALREGVRAVLPPDAAVADIVAVLGAVARGFAVLPAGLLGPLVGRRAPGAAAGLTPRERQVLDLLAAGASNKIVARRLGLSFHTAKAHVAAVLQKLGATSRADAVARGARAGLVLL